MASQNSELSKYFSMPFLCQLIVSITNNTLIICVGIIYKVSLGMIFHLITFYGLIAFVAILNHFVDRVFDKICHLLMQRYENKRTDHFLLTGATLGPTIVHTWTQWNMRTLELKIYKKSLSMNLFHFCTIDLLFLIKFTALIYINVLLIVRFNVDQMTD